jgi:radical SAM protein with 4Fe4S-binding SPASM domain
VASRPRGIQRLAAEAPQARLDGRFRCYCERARAAGKAARLHLPMATTPSVYDKSDSFVEIRQRHPAEAEAHARIEGLATRLAATGGADYRSQIVREACEELRLFENGEPARFTLRDFVVEEISKLDDAELERYLFYRFRYEVFPREHRLDDFPPLLQIEPTSICNFRCVFCYQTDEAFTNPKSGHMGLMSLDLFKRVVDEAEGRCEAITLASRGEPTLHKQLPEMLDYLAGKFLAVKINTNASKLDERLCHAILKAGVQTLVFSADAASEPLYSQLRVRGNLEQTVANVKLFRDIREKHYPGARTITRVSGVKVSDDQDLGDLDFFWSELVDQVAFVKYNPWENTYEQPVNNIDSPCSEYWRRTFVLWDGTMNPCDTDYRATLTPGNVKDDSVSAIWAGSKYENFRKLHLARERRGISPCNRCTVI